jgi:ABC-2 type transport system ATP-binding protein
MLEARNLSKSFEEDQAVDDLSFTLEKGEIVGLIGPNGAGKSTTMEMCAGLETPDSGEVSAEEPLRECVGIVFQNLEMRAKVTVEEFLGLMKTLNDSKVEVEEVLEELNFDEGGSFVEELSGGQKKKVNIASALVKNPEYVLLDESATGLDVQSRTGLEETIRSLSDNRGVLLSTHSMEIAERLCDRVIIIEDGRKVVDGDLDELLKDLDAGYVLRAEGEVPERYRDEARVSGDSFEIFADSPHEVLKDLVESGVIDELDGITVEKPGLEEVYLEKTGERYAEDR